MEVKAARGDAALAGSADGSEEDSWQYQPYTATEKLNAVGAGLPGRRKDDRVGEMHVT